MKRLLLRTVLICFALLTLFACKNNLNDTWAGKLAAIDAGTVNITENDILPYNVLLNKLEVKCGDTQNEIADTTVRAKNLFKSTNEQEISNLSIMQMIDGAIPDGMIMNCNEVIAVIIALS